MSSDATHSPATTGRDAARPPRPWRLPALALALLALIVVPFLVFGAAIDAWSADFIARGRANPWQTALVLGGLLAVDVLAPTPSSLVSTACGALLGFWGGLLASFAGMTLSVALGLLLGRLAAPAARRALGPREQALLLRMQNRWGLWMLAAARPVPVLAEASVLFAGLAKFPWRGALPALLLGNLAVSAVYAACGALASAHRATPLAFAAAALLSGVALWLARGMSVKR